MNQSESYQHVVDPKNPRITHLIPEGEHNIHFFDGWCECGMEFIPVPALNCASYVHTRLVVPDYIPEEWPT